MYPWEQVDDLEKIATYLKKNYNLGKTKTSQLKFSKLLFSEMSIFCLLYVSITNVYLKCKKNKKNFRK